MKDNAQFTQKEGGNNNKYFTKPTTRGEAHQRHKPRERHLAHRPERLRRRRPNGQIEK